MEITINGQPRQLPAAFTVSGMVEALGLAPTQVAVERGGAIVPRSAWEKTVLAEGDVIEIVKFIGEGDEIIRSSDHPIIR